MIENMLIPLTVYSGWFLERLVLLEHYTSYPPKPKKEGTFGYYFSNEISKMDKMFEDSGRNLPYLFKQELTSFPLFKSAYYCLKYRLKK